VGDISLDAALTGLSWHVQIIVAAGQSCPSLSLSTVDRWWI